MSHCNYPLIFFFFFFFLSRTCNLNPQLLEPEACSAHWKCHNKMGWNVTFSFELLMANNTVRVFCHCCRFLVNPGREVEVIWPWTQPLPRLPVYRRTMWLHVVAGGGYNTILRLRRRERKESELSGYLQYLSLLDGMPYWLVLRRVQISLSHPRKSIDVSCEFFTSLAMYVTHVKVHLSHPHSTINRCKLQMRGYSPC